MKVRSKVRYKEVLEYSFDLSIFSASNVSLPAMAIFSCLSLVCIILMAYVAMSGTLSSWTAVSQLLICRFVLFLIWLLSHCNLKCCLVSTSPSLHTRCHLFPFFLGFCYPLWCMNLILHTLWYVVDICRCSRHMIGLIQGQFMESHFLWHYPLWFYWLTAQLLGVWCLEKRG